MDTSSGHDVAIEYTFEIDVAMVDTSEDVAVVGPTEVKVAMAQNGISVVVTSVENVVEI